LKLRGIRWLVFWGADILPSHQKDEAIRLAFFGDEIEAISLIDALTGQKKDQVDPKR